MTEINDPTFEAPEDELQQLIRFIKNYGVPVLIGLAIVIALSVARTTYQNKTKASSDDAAGMLANAVQVQDMDGKIRQLEDIIAQYPSTSSAPLALLAIAKTYFDQQKCDVALSKYDEFIKNYPKHDLVKGAEVGKAHCLEELGSKEMALKSYIAFAEANNDHFLTPEAQLGRARCLISLGRKAEAQEICEDLLTAKPDTFWAMRAEYYLEEATSTPKVKSLLPPPTIKTVSTMPEMMSISPDTATPTMTTLPKEAAEE